jgi:hypothetical protein
MAAMVALYRILSSQQQNNDSWLLLMDGAAASWNLETALSI